MPPARAVSSKSSGNGPCMVTVSRRDSQSGLYEVESGIIVKKVSGVGCQGSGFRVQGSGFRVGIFTKIMWRVNQRFGIKTK
jgi:hypothetical protein